MNLYSEVKLKLEEDYFDLKSKTQFAARSKMLSK